MMICGKEIKEGDMVLIKDKNSENIGYIYKAKLFRLFGCKYVLCIDKGYPLSDRAFYERSIKSIDILVPKKSERKQKKVIIDQSKEQPEFESVPSQDGGA